MLQDLHYYLLGTVEHFVTGDFAAGAKISVMVQGETL